MAVKLDGPGARRFRGWSTDTKPGTDDGAVQPEGSIFDEMDTGRRFIYHNGGWQRQPQTIETLLREVIDRQEEIIAILRATHLGHECHLWDAEVEVE